MLNAEKGTVPLFGVAEMVVFADLCLESMQRIGTTGPVGGWSTPKMKRNDHRRSRFSLMHAPVRQGLPRANPRKLVLDSMKEVANGDVAAESMWEKRAGVVECCWNAAGSGARFGTTSREAREGYFEGGKVVDEERRQEVERIRLLGVSGLVMSFVTR